MLCSSRMERFLFKNGYWLYRCPRCQFAQTDLAKNYLTFVKDHYSEGYFLGDPTRSAYANYELDKPVIVQNMRKFLGRILQKKTSGKLLDVGCAYGYFVELAMQNGFDAYGFDPSTYAVSQARKLVGKARIQEGTISEVRYKKNTYDVITLFDVFEHLQDPIADLKKLRGLLKHDGIIIIATGNAQSIAAKVFGRRWTFYIPPQHLSFFTKLNLQTFLTRVGLSPIDWFGIGKWLSLDYILHLAKTTGESTIGAILHHWLSRSFVSRLPIYVPMMDNMVVIAQKK